MKIFTMLCFISLVTFSAHAEQQSSKESVEKLMELTEVAKMMDAMHGQMRLMFDEMSKQMDISEKDKPIYDNYTSKYADLLEEQMNWQTFKGPMIEIYSNHFTEEEVKGFITFYESDIGKSMVRKMPMIMQDSMLVSQELMKDFLPKMQALSIEMQKEIQEARKGGTEE